MVPSPMELCLTEQVNRDLKRNGYLLREEDKVLERCHRSFSSSRGAVSVSVKMCTRYSRRRKEEKEEEGGD